MSDNETPKYLISIAVGPVQDFIASSRRTRDLWFGSWLLSELSKVVAKEIGHQNLIFPAISDSRDLDADSTFIVVNKILAVVDNPQSVEINCSKVIKQRLRSIYEEPIFGMIEKKLNQETFPQNYFKRDVAEAQILEMTEFYWAAYPYATHNYAECRQRVEILLNARKSTRDFDAATWASSTPKSSIDGQRESVIDEEAYDKLTPRQLRDIFGVRRGERLCGVGILKRLGNAKDKDGNRIDSFFSTSHVASQPLLKTLDESDENKASVRTFVTAVKNHLNLEERDLGIVPHHYPYQTHDVFSRQLDGKLKGYDGNLLFENRLKDLVEDQKEEGEFKNELNQIKAALFSFLKNAFKGETPDPYYALLLADGDNMGKTIEKIDKRNIHYELSQELSAFATKVEEIVITRHGGSLIYAGGDDVLAFVPLHTVLDCAKDLADEFQKPLQKFACMDNGEAIRPTLSVGIAVAHHTEPLQESLKTMRQAEKVAKTVKGKNALAIIMSKRSGADTTIKGSWSNEKKDQSFYERLNWFIYLHLADALPDGVAYELRDLWLHLFHKEKQSLERVIKAESVRILKRKRVEGGTKALSEYVRKKIEAFIATMTFPYKGNPTLTWTIEDLANEIIVARDFAKAQNQSGVSAIAFAKGHNLEEPENDFTTLDN